MVQKYNSCIIQHLKAAGDIYGQLDMVERIVMVIQTLYAKIETKVDDPTNGQETGFLDFSTRGLSSYNSIFRLKIEADKCSKLYCR